jgi:hypothetical protein
VDALALIAFLLPDDLAINPTVLEAVYYGGNVWKKERR